MAQCVKPLPQKLGVVLHLNLRTSIQADTMPVFPMVGWEGEKREIPEAPGLADIGSTEQLPVSNT